MALAAGSRLGVYEVIDLIGSGGMGDVYRARDSRLGREIALKVLPDRVSTDPHRMARLEREARVLAALNHPNVAVIHGLEDLAGGPGHPSVKALVMELVDGETLADRLARGPLTVENALETAGQIADALEAAHEKGIVHRDLKPANVKISSSDVVKVLDFGLARVSDNASPLDPTVSLEMTAAGAILGTPGYMAPEQVQGTPVDERADIWAFGVMLYEMVTGKRLFRGGSVHETYAAVFTTTPDWNLVPPPVQPLLRACLERDPRRRLRHIGDYRFLIAAQSSAAPHTNRHGRWWMAFAGLLLIAAAALAALGSFRLYSTPRPQLVRLTTMLPSGVSVTRGPGYASSVAVSPDGQTIVIAGMAKDDQRLYQRATNRLEATPLRGTERGSSPFFSPDGMWIGFFADGWLKRIPSSGGAAVDIVATPNFPAGASWGRDGRIVFAFGDNSPLRSVDADGGEAEEIDGIESGRHPEVLGDGSAILFESGGWIYAFDRQSGHRIRVVQGAAPRYAIGRLIFSRGTTLLAAPLDVSRYELTGPVVPLFDGVAVELPGSGGGRHYAISDNGTLAYVPAASAYELVLVGADGTERRIADPQRSFENPRFSPSGRQVVVAATRREGEPADLWIHDLQTKAVTRLTSDGGRAPLWGPDGATVTYSHLGDRQGIYTKRADDGGGTSLLLPLKTFHWLVGWTSDRRTLAFGAMDGGRSSIHLHKDERTDRVVGPGSTWGGRLSPDGRWLAYYSLDSGTFEVLVTPFPGGGMRWLIAAGTDPAWAPDGREMYYRSGPRLMAARIDMTSGVRVLSHRVVIEPFLPPLYDDYDIHPDGRTLVMVKPAGNTQGREVAMVVNWFDELRRLVESR